MARRQKKDDGSAAETFKLWEQMRREANEKLGIVKSRKPKQPKEFEQKSFKKKPAVADAGLGCIW